MDLTLNFTVNYTSIMLPLAGADPGYVERGGGRGGGSDFPQDFGGNLDAPNAFSRILIIYFRLSLC